MRVSEEKKTVDTIFHDIKTDWTTIEGGTYGIMLLHEGGFTEYSRG